MLGVCLGHQGIVIGAGGVVDLAPAARHGYLDRISHNGRDLFAGLPQDFTAVRYHSLCARRPLPDALEITAATADGVVMGVRHRSRPQWGVQFHPESVAGEYGAALLRNFAELTARHHGDRRPTPATERKPNAWSRRWRDRRRWAGPRARYPIRSDSSATTSDPVARDRNDSTTPRSGWANWAAPGSCGTG